MQLGVTRIGQADPWMGRGFGRWLPGLTLILAVAPGWAAPRRRTMPGRRPGPLPWRRYVPREGLAAYLEFDGLDAHQAAWKGSAAYKLLNETKLGPLIEDILRQLIVMSQAPIQPADLIGGFKHVRAPGHGGGSLGQGARGSPLRHGPSRRRPARAAPADRHGDPGGPPGRCGRREGRPHDP